MRSFLVAAVALALTTGTAFRCQRAIAVGTAGAAVEHLRGAILGVPARRADRRAREQLRRVDMDCRVAVRHDQQFSILPPSLAAVRGQRSEYLEYVHGFFDPG